MSIHPVVLLGMLALLAACGTDEPSGPHVIVAVNKLSAGGHSTCSLGSGGGMACWGQVPEGAAYDSTIFGPISRGASSVPTPIGFTSLSVAKTGFSPTGCAVGTDAQVYCWGALEVHFDLSAPFPSGITALAGGSSASSVAMDKDHFCITRTDLAVRCYGGFEGGARGSDSVDLSTVDPDYTLTPNGLSPSQTAFATAAGEMFGCALRTDSLIACWGTRTRGQLGGAVGDTVQDCTVWAPAWCQPGPALIAGGQKYRQVAAAYDHACAVRIDGTIDCWGRKAGSPFEGGVGVCGTPSDCPNAPTQVPLPGTAVRVTTGLDHTCALLTTGAAYCWGDNTLGQLGRPGASSLTPVAVAGGFEFSTLSAGNFHTCGIELGSGAVGCWGNNDFGQLGDGSTTMRDHPVAVIAAE